MGRSIDDYDYEVQLNRDEKIKVGFMINFKSMSIMINRIEEETKEIDDKYPKSELLKIWAGIMVCLFVLIIIPMVTSGIMFVATLPFAFFYLYTLFQLFKAWKRFKYKMGFLRLITFGGIILEIALAALASLLKA